MTELTRYSEQQEAEREAVLSALGEAYDLNSEFSFLSFRAIAERAGIDVRDVRAACRSLAARGHAQFQGGLVTEDFAMYGSGYAITPAGRLALQEKNNG